MDGDENIYKGKPPANSDPESLVDKSMQRGGTGPTRTCESLRLNLAAAAEGKTWMLLPEGFRDRESGTTYPLPSRRKELQKLVIIPIPSSVKTDSGCIYIRRAIDAFMKRDNRRLAMHLDAGRKEQEMNAIKAEMNRKAREFSEQASRAVESVRQEADKAIASLNDLFALGREGLGSIMRAHLAGSEWQGEKVSTDQFMGCFRMVSQAVKGLGLPSEQRSTAHAAIMEQVAASIKDTKEAVAMAPGNEETKQ